MMREALKNFPSQFLFEPAIEDAARLTAAKVFVVGGMGGSPLAAELLKTRDPAFPLFVHKNYGLPALPGIHPADCLYIATSYSGNTEEVIDFLEAARTNGCSLAVIAKGGALFERAEQYLIPRVRIPDTGIEPRVAVGFLLRAALAVTGRADLLEETKSLFSSLPGDAEQKGATLAQALYQKVPVIYSSEQNHAIAYNWKIKFNETSKIPAFYNVLPETNHNEMTGFDRASSTKDLSENFHFIFLKSASDHPRIVKRMTILEAMYAERGLETSSISLSGSGAFEAIFLALLTADWASLLLAERYGVEPEHVPMVEDFKKRMAL